MSYNKLYSRKNIPQSEWINLKVAHRLIPKSFNVFPYKAGNTKCVVMELISPSIEDIHKQLIKVGGTHDYDKFIPHVTLACDIDKTFDVKNLSLPKFELFTSRIKTEDLDLNWASKK